MIKIFTSNKEPKDAGDDLTSQFETWQKSMSNIEIIQIHSNSNSYGWMIIIHYNKI